MASGGTNGGQSHFFLTPQQQRLLFAALNSNKQPASQPPATNPLPFSPNSLQMSPAQEQSLDGFQETPLLDNYDYEFGDSSFDFDFANESQQTLIGDLPGQHKSESPENDSPDKRAHPDDDESNDSTGASGAKRRESTEKVAKKPGRKPLTSEPSSKRKAQNRAAQRAFRERKEKHLKDLEDKVEELHKASETANHENNLLRVQVQKMSRELQEYKTRLSLVTSRSLAPGRPRTGFGAPAVGNINDVNFQFEFPKFGVLPATAATATTTGTAANSQPSKSSTPRQVLPGKPAGSTRRQENTESPVIDNGGYNVADSSSKYSKHVNTKVSPGSISASRTSIDSSGHSQATHSTSTSSPSASSQSQGGSSSSCGTSPEPLNQSPMGFKPVDTMATIGEEQPSFPSGEDNSLFASIDPNSFDWLAHQNGGQFDPDLFSSYREPQDNILANSNFDDGFFKDALDADFFTPYNMAPNPALPKRNLIDQIDAAQDADNDLAKQDAVKQEGLDCEEVWEKIQNCPTVQNGDFDLDSLCSELQKKAKCSGTGSVVSEGDFDTVMKKWLGKDISCVKSSTS
ncbi:PAP1-domain-containing protein [Sodiomyces alkalinus F11]|uniref:PAP1-domain-containing protein n=1 Tax=Sodiomyces alkalinus (strain CBS 110278 / VKM F-3762 / F11) TaxID=1314773 RepID=A0A3N2PQ02_SODAK|nr:PAP1-domain-containing protein [Sodiomyces alkalinus F11]ROT36593.1 PAP1-domain-containing protein [Sodiomyces alkalinus F11]